MTDSNFEEKVFQTLEKDGEEFAEEMKVGLEVFDESKIDRDKKLDKAMKVAKIGYYTSKGISSIVGAVLGAKLGFTFISILQTDFNSITFLAT